MDKLREFTESEIRDKFLAHVWQTINYWDALPNRTNRNKMEGLAFSILSSLDGSSAALPKFIVAPDPHPDDREFLRGEDENWYPENHAAPVKCDISGCLHELFYKARR